MTENNTDYDEGEEQDEEVIETEGDGRVIVNESEQEDG